LTCFGGAAPGISGGRSASRIATMKYLCLVYHDEDAEVDAMTAEEFEAVAEEVRDYIGGLRDRRQHIVAAPLQAPDTAATVRLRRSQLSVTDGPFVETKEHLAGFYLIEARDLNDAIRIISRSPSARFGSIEVRPLREMLYMPPEQLMASEAPG
jgi:hypothetical protein